MKVFGIAGRPGMGRSTLRVDLLERMQRCDRVLIEGFKNGGFPKPAV